MFLIQLILTSKERGFLDNIRSDISVRRLRYRKNSCLDSNC